MKTIPGLKDSYKLAIARGIGTPFKPQVRKANKAGVICFWLAIVGGLVLWCAVGHADEPEQGVYSNSQIVEAIKYSEGKNKKGWYSYGIKSVKCEREKECRAICFNTVRNNRKRFTQSGRNITFVEYLSQRYCPIKAQNDPNGLNKNWLKNVKYFLNHPKKG